MASRIAFRLYIHCENDAFAPGDIERSEEVARILRETADRVVSGDIRFHYKTLFDINGNDVGRAAFKPYDAREVAP